MKHISLVFAVFVVGACEGKEEACPAIDTVQCSQRSDCVVLSGSEMLDNGECYSIGPEQALGCISADEPCDNYITPAQNGSGPAILFTSSCLPEGYEIIIFEQYPECDEE